MKKIVILIFVFLASLSYSQLNNTASINVKDIIGSLPDTTRPYFKDLGMRSVYVSEDLDGDNKIEVLVTDYSNGGRVHCFEMTNANTLELIWSSPGRAYMGNINSTPRWVRTGDLDGDGNREIIFPIGGRYTGEIQVWENDGPNSFGSLPAFTLPSSYFSSQLPVNSSFRMDREVGEVYDFDDDGLDELVFQNQNNNVYVLGVFGQFPGFAAWQIEGGDPAVVPVNSGGFPAGSHWHSIPADINGDGKVEIVSHMWNYWGFWSIKPIGPDSYSYPDTSVDRFYCEYGRMMGIGDAVAYMGIQAVDVDGDGNQEISGVLYGGTAEAYSMGLLNFNNTDTGLYVWDTTKFGVIAKNVWTVSGNQTGSIWGIGAADLNANGREEILVGGTNGYNLTAIEYKGTGNVLDENSYEKYVLYPGTNPYMYYIYTIRDSAGVIDTIKTESPFVSKISKPFDSNNNGKVEIAVSYQSVTDSIKYDYKRWDGATFVTDSTVKKYTPVQFNMRIFESTTTGIEVKELTIVTPDDYTLEQNYPNPFNPSTTIRFSLPVDKKISLKVYDILGNLVTTLIDGQDFANGSYEAVWDGKNNFGTSVASGMYIAELQFGNFSKTIKMQLLK